jgi:hypothetical protein
MKIVYYPDMYIPENTLKTLLLCWGNVSSIVPPSIKEYNDRYLDGHSGRETNYPLETYKEILDKTGEKIVDFLVISDNERKRASEKMFDLVTNWNKNTGFYNSLKIHSIDNFIGKPVEWYWFLHEKLESPLVQLLQEERLVVNWAPGEIVGYQQVGKSYMSIIAEEIKKSRKIRLVTDDEFYLAAKSPVDLVDFSTTQKVESTYQYISLAIPQVFFHPKTIQSLSWNEVLKIRRELLPYAERYHREIEKYQKSINSLQLEGKENEAFNKFSEMCERIVNSFKPFSVETSKVLRLMKNNETLGFVTGIMLPTIKILNPYPELIQVCDIATISLASLRYGLPKILPQPGFDYLENLSRRLQIYRMKGMVTCLIPKRVKKPIHWYRYRTL